MKNMKKKVGKILISSTMILTMAFSVVPTNVNAQENNTTNSSREGNILINESTFPDANFRRYVLTEIDTNTDQSLSQAEIDGVKSINVWAKSITSLDGIEFFTALTELNCSSNKLTSLDLKNNSNLEVLDCSNTRITSLDLSNNLALTSLHCKENHINSLDLSKNVSLKLLYCPRNKLTNLDLSNNSQLETLECVQNELTSLDVTNNTALKSLKCSSQKRTIAFNKNKGYLLNGYDAEFDKGKATDFVGATLEEDGTLSGVTLGTPITYNYNTGYVDGAMNVSLTFRVQTDEEKLADAKQMAESEINKIKATNDTTAKNILDAVTKIVSSADGVTASWLDGSPIITKATNDKDGSITGKIILTSGSDTVEVAVNMVINKQSVIDDDKLAKAKSLAETAIKDMVVSNTTTDKDFLDTVKNSITSITGVTTSWKSGSPIITKATNDKDGSIIGMIVLTRDSKTVEITVNKVINKLSSKTTIVDKATGIKIAYEDGSTFADDITLVITPISKEEVKKLQDDVNKAVTGKTIAGVYDIKLLKNGAEIQPNGKLKISLALTNEMKTMSELQVVYIDDNGKVTIIPSQLIDGELVFITDHFSYYGIIGKGNSIGQIKPDSPQTGDTSNTMLYIGLVVLSGCLAGYGLKKKKL